MRILLKILNYFFTTLGILFFLIILIGIYLFITDPFGLKPLFSSLNIPANTTVDMIDKNPLLTPAQEKTVESLGIDPTKLPTAITPELEKCLLQKLGAQRADEIIKGSAPTAMDVLKASVCL